ncbi:MAG: hypothetical protein Q8940_20470 [Bacteroidota bacterium]|nr:hypothetical protein [Bacteroidota bacterium]
MEIQLTHSSKESVFSLGYFPADDRFLFTSDQGGNELNHIYVRQLDGAEERLVLSCNGPESIEFIADFIILLI